MIEFDGVRSTALGVFVEKYPPRPIPKRKHEKFSVPGRSGDVIAYEDAWENVLQPYDIYLSAEKPGLPLVAAKVTRWLMADGYRRLEDEYDRDTFRLAAFLGPVDLENTLNEFGRARIEFDCQPQRYLKIGARPITAENGMTLQNPTGYTARPLLTVFGSGSGTITLGTYSVSLSVITNGMTLDCAEEEAYFYSGSVLNLNTVVSGAYPKLAAGASAVTWAGGVTGLTIIPRWYEL